MTRPPYSSIAPIPTELASACNIKTGAVDLNLGGRQVLELEQVYALEH